jgi:membrane associated rhomboid family serine protease
LDAFDNPVVILYRSLLRSRCEERALVLTALGIASAVSFDGLEFALSVQAPDALAAQYQLQLYEAESRTEKPVARSHPAPSRSYPHAWIGCLLYVAVLVAIGYAVAHGVGPLDAFERGELDAGRVQSGQWWRAWTALTLHLDAAHLAGNLGAGVWFGYFAGRQLGSGTAWLLIVSGAACANLLEAHLGPAAHRSVGASTAVFTALGLLAAHAWRTRYRLPQRAVLRWSPLVGGLVLLGWFGSAGTGTDIVAHALGFAVGCAFGVIAAGTAVRQMLERWPQWLPGAAALLSVALAWSCALGG